MKKFILVGAFLILIVAVWLLCRKTPAGELSVSLKQEHLNASMALPQKSLSTEMVLTNGNGKSDAGIDPRWAEVERKKKMDRAWEWKTPIEFYGQVLDENQLPVSNATVEFGWTDDSPNGSSEQVLQSGQNGKFELSGVHGKRLGISVSKTGYYVSLRKNQCSFEYSGFWEDNYHVPDKNKPVIFHLRKQGVTEPMTHCNVSPDASGHGEAVSFDLFTGRKLATGQFVFEAWRPPIRETRDGPFEWRARITIRDGGFMQHDDEFPFVAPLTGYSNSVEFVMMPGVTNWNYAVSGDYYFYFGSPPKYGRVSFRTGGASTGFALDCFVNPSGSRNLEFDMAKDVSGQY